MNNLLSLKNLTLLYEPGEFASGIVYAFTPKKLKKAGILIWIDEAGLQQLRVIIETADKAFQRVMGSSSPQTVVTSEKRIPSPPSVTRAVSQPSAPLKQQALARKVAAIQPALIAASSQLSPRYRSAFGAVALVVVAIICASVYSPKPSTSRQSTLTSLNITAEPTPSLLSAATAVTPSLSAADKKTSLTKVRNLLKGKPTTQRIYEANRLLTDVKTHSAPNSTEYKEVQKLQANSDSLLAKINEAEARAEERAKAKEEREERERQRSESTYSSGASSRYITGPRGGCYYINRNGNKTYVDRSMCGGSSYSYSYGGTSRRSNGYIRGPRGGCYYINGNGNKTYVDRSMCN